MEYDRKYEVKMTSITFKLIVYPSFENSLEEREGEMKYILDFFFKLHFPSGRLL